MGCGPFSGRKISSTGSYKTDTRNPNPLLFEVLRTNMVGDLLLAKVKYLGCTNYEGNKILVFQGVTEDEFKKLCELDPHFSENSKLVARFKPTEEGWLMAVGFAIMWSKI